MDKIKFFKESIEDYEKLLCELENQNAPIDAIELVKESIRTNKILLENCILREEETRALSTPVSESQAPKEDSGLTVGRVFKNYKELCKFMGWKPTGGDYKKSRLKELDSLCKWHNEGYKFVIDEVYKQQLLKKDKRRDKAIYVNPIKGILFYSLKDFKGELYFSVNKFIELLEIFNKKYCDLQIDSDYQEVALETGIDVYTLKGFKIGSKREAQRIIERALKSMKSQRILDYMQGRIIVTNDNNYRFAIPEERRVIQRIEEEELKKLNCFNMASLKYKNLENKFYYRIKQRFHEEGLDYINYTFYGYSIVSHDKTITEQIELLEKEANVVELKGLFKKRLEEFAIGNHSREVKKELDSVGFGEAILEFNPIASSSYIPNFQKAIDTFI